MRRLLCALGVVALLPSATADSADWVRVETPSFVVYGEAGERRTREIAAEFERFREALARVLPAARARAAVPTVVVVFETAASLEPYRPVFNGKRVEVAGYFRGSEHENLVALATENRAGALRTIFHEYTHLALANVLPAIPAWLSEGLADYYSTFEVRDDGRRAAIGAVVPAHVRLLATTSMMPMAQLFAVTHESSDYHEGNRRSLFYAQAWALVHYIIAERPDGSAALARYATLASAGMGAAGAWQEVFGSFDPVKPAEKYLARRQVKGFIYTFKAGIEPVPAAVSKVEAAELDAVLGNLLTRAGTSFEADVRFERAIAADGSAARARALLGLNAATAGKGREALDLLLPAALDADWLTAYYAVTGLERAIEALDGDERRRAADAAARALATVLAARPEMPHALALRSGIAYRTGGNVADALADIRRARALAPGRDDYAFAEVRLLIRQDAFAAARGVLGPLLSPFASSGTREHARTLMAQVVAMEAEAAERSRRAATPTALIPIDEPALPGAAPPAEPVYRIMRDGEQRTEGLLERIDCGARGAVTLHLRADGRLLRFVTARMASIEFITYRSAPGESIGCAPRVPPERVYLTWRPLSPPRTGITGRAVAVEFLPK